MFRLSLLVVLLAFRVSSAQLVFVEAKGVCQGSYCTAASVPIYSGTGVAVDETDDGAVVVATAGHIFEHPISSVRIGYKGQWHSASKIASVFTGDDDLALLKVQGSIAVAPLGGDPCPGDTLTTAGFEYSRTFKRFTGQCLSCTDRHGLMQGTLIEGMSGGPVSNANKEIVGIAVTREGDVDPSTGRVVGYRTGFVPSYRIKEFIKIKVKTKRRYIGPVGPPRQLAGPTPVDSAPAPPAEKPVPTPDATVPTPHPANPDANNAALVELIQKLSAKVDALANRPVEPGPKGDKGDKGDQGPVGTTGVTGKPGRDGAAGPKGDAGKDGKPGVITVILQDAKGNIIKQVDDAVSGSTVRLDVTKSVTSK